MSDTSFELRPARINDALVLTVSGEVDMATAPELDAQLTLIDPGIERVVIDLSAVGFLDSSALNVLVRARRLFAERSIALRIVEPADRAVQRVFEITRLSEPLNLVATLEEALAS